MMRQTWLRWSWWVAVAVLVAGTGYTAGYLLAPREPAAISRTLPDVQPDVPQPMMPRQDPVNEA